MGNLTDVPKGATHYNDVDELYYKIIGNEIMFWSSIGCWAENTAFTFVTKQEPTSPAEPVDIWKNAPEGCNAMFTDFLSKNSAPGLSSTVWEKWEDGRVYDWNGADSWCFYNAEDDCDKSERIFRPKEEIVSAKEKNTPEVVIGFQPLPKPDFSKMPETTRVAVPVGMYQVHKYIKENLKIEKVNALSEDGWYDHMLQLVLAGEVISEIEM